MDGFIRSAGCLKPRWPRPSYGAAAQADAACVMLKAGHLTVRESLRRRFGVLAGAREYWHPAHRTPDEQDTRALLRVSSFEVQRRVYGTDSDDRSRPFESPYALQQVLKC